jgi:succinate dehydrogenase/fumarate reductase flavoprotein subunit
MATGDGIAMAYRSGAEIADMEFTDFYAYGCVWPPVGRGEGWPAILVYNLQAVMRNNAGREFMKDYSGARRVPPKAVALELAAGRGSNRGGVFLSVNQLPPEVVRKYLDSLGHQRWLDGLKERDFDLTKEAVEIAPFPITSFGGCRINHRCETSVEGLYAAGEAASGHQGAYVMVGNMVGSSSAMGCIAGENAAARADRICHRDLDDNRVGELFGRILKGHGNPGGHRPVEVKREVARILRQYAYVIGRNEAGLRRGIEELASLKAESLSNMCISDKNDRFNLSWVHALEAVNQVEVAHLIMTSALERTESRGCHFRDDHPDENPQWNRRIVMSLDHGKVRMSLQPVQFVHLTPPVKQA